MMPSNILYLSEDDVQSLLHWNQLIPAIEKIMSDVSNKSDNGKAMTIQPARGIMSIPKKKAFLLTMPGFSERNQVLSCKLVTAFLENKESYGLPTVIANIALFDPNTGELNAIVAGTAITEWRTAAASVVATKFLKPDIEPNQVLAVLGAGRQGRIHILAFSHFFKFHKINLWSRTFENAKKLSEELQREFNIEVKVFSNAKDCTISADVIITATHASEPILKYDYIKPNALINAIGAGTNHHSELDMEIYENASIYTDSMENARIELKGLENAGLSISGEIGEIINGEKTANHSGTLIFHSLGMASEDAVAGKLVLDNFLSRKGH